jgi:hypothetical protein
LVIVPPLLGFTDQTRENPGGGLGEAVKVVVEPMATAIGAGITASLRGRGVGFGKPFSVLEPVPQPVRPRIMTKTNARAVRRSSIPSFAFKGTAASGLVGSWTTTRREKSAEERVERFANAQRTPA